MADSSGFTSQQGMVCNVDIIPAADQAGEVRTFL